MKEIFDYIKLSKAKRQEHLNLDSPCVERGGSSKEFRGLLAYYLDTSLPSGKKIHLCHACHNGKCSNPKHLYWGTAVENNDDRVANGFNPGEALKKSLGSKEAIKSFYQMIGSKGGHKGEKRHLSPEEINRRLNVIKNCDVNERGWVVRAANALNVSHTQVKRFVDKHGDLV